MNFIEFVCGMPHDLKAALLLAAATYLCLFIVAELKR